jgi:tetratricopeptide (TPR) repeat protein
MILVGGFANKGDAAQEVRVKVLSLVLALVLLPQAATVAQQIDAPCFMVESSGQIRDLTNLCATTVNTHPSLEDQAQALIDQAEAQMADHRNPEAIVTLSRALDLLQPIVDAYPNSRAAKIFEDAGRRQASVYYISRNQQAGDEVYRRILRIYEARGDREGAAMMRRQADIGRSFARIDWDRPAGK